MKKLVVLLMGIVLCIGVVLASCQTTQPPATDTQETAAADTAADTATDTAADTATDTAADTAPDGKDPKDVVIAIVPKALDNPIFLDCKVGGEKKGEELGITVEWTGSTNSTASEQVTVIEGLIQKGVDGILISCNDADALKDVIDHAVDKGIVVATFGSDSPESKRSFVIGTDNYSLGEESAKYMNELLPDGGKIAVLTGVLGAPDLEPRVQAVKEHVNANIEVLAIQTGEDDIQKSVEVVNQFTAANTDLAGWIFVGGWPFFADPTSLTEFTNFMDNSGKCVSVDTFYPMLEFLENDYCQVLIGQDFTAMGRDGVQYLYDIIVNGQQPPSDNIVTKNEILTEDNVAEAKAGKTPW